jgi:hypothetical protein
VSPKVTLSVPHDLYKRIDRRKYSFNLSKIFQKAVSEEIEKKEKFQKLIKEDPTMPEIIQRLRNEKEADFQDYFQKGEVDGLQWAKAASYSELQFALKWETVNEIPRNTIGWDPTTNEVLGDYFRDMIEDDTLMGFEKTSPGNFMPNEFFRRWELGWKAAVVEFWNQIKNQI